MQKITHSLPFYFFTTLIIYMFFFLVISAEHASTHIIQAIDLCTKRIIPSLFPFMVLNEIILSSGLAKTLGNIFGRPFSKLLKIKKECSSAIISGMLLGFPLGTKSAVSLYTNGYISKEETEDLICFCSNTGPAFVLGFVAPILGNKSLAVIIYVSQLLAALVIALFLSHPKKENKTEHRPHSPAQANLSLTAAVINSVIPILNVCAFVCFFSCITCSLEELLSFLGLNNTFTVFFSGLLELSNGIALAAELCGSFEASIFSAFFIGWSGLSVILQSHSICSPNGICCKKFVAAKLIQGILCAFFTFVFCKLMKTY